MNISGKLICLAGLLFLSSTAFSQITHRDLLQKKYSAAQIKTMIAAPGQWKPFPQTPQGWKAQLPDTLISHLIANGERALKEDFSNIPATVALEFVRNGNRTDYEKASFSKRNTLLDLVLAESVEGKGRFTDHIVDGVWSICEESFWGLIAHTGMQKAGVGLPDVKDPVVDLFAAETGADLAWTDYFVGAELDKVSKMIRPRIHEEINRRILVPMATAQYGFMGGGDTNAKLNNWAPWIMSNYLVANLLLQKDDQKRLQGLNIVMKITDQYINGLGEDGGCDEGPGYWSAAGGTVFDILTVLNDVSKGGIDIFHEPIIQKMGAYIYKTHIAGKYFVNVADAHPQDDLDGVMMYRFGKVMNDKQMTGFGSWAYRHYGNNTGSGNQRFNNTRVLYNLSALHDISAYTSSYTDVSDAWLPDVQLMVSHLPGGLFVSSHGGTNGESHNHNDVGDFTVYADGDPVIIDVGSGTYTSKTFSAGRYTIWYNNSSYHNLPAINGLQQKDGSRYAASGVSYAATAKSHELSMDIAKAYPEQTGLKKWQRVIRANKSGSVEITDHYSLLSAPKSLTQSFMTVCSTDLSEPGKIVFTTAKGTKVWLSYNAGLWQASKEKMSLTAPEDQALKTGWQHWDIYRVLLTAKTGKKESTVRYVISK